MLAKTVLKNTIYYSSSILAVNLISLLVIIFLARILKPELFGIYSLSIAIISLFLILADLGINSATTRYIAEAISKNDKSLAASYSRFFLSLKLLLSFLIVFFVLLLSPKLSEIFDKPIKEPLMVLSLFLFFISINNLFNAMANAMNDFRINLLNSVLQNSSKLFFTVALVLLGLSLFGAILALIISSLLAMAFSIYYVSRNYGFLFEKGRKFQKSNVLRFIVFTAATSITWTVFANVDIVMIGFFLSSEEVAFYRASFSIISAAIGIVSFPTVLLPVFVKLEGDDLKRAFARTFKYSSALCIPAAFGIAMIAENLLLFAYGIDYISGLEAMRILSTLLISPVFGIYGSIFSSKEKPELIFYPMSLSMFLNVILNWLMIPIYGINGAAIATVISNVVFWSLLTLICAREFEIIPNLYHLVKPTISSIVMLIVGVNVDSTIFVIPISILVYSVFMFLIRGITREDVNFILSIAKL
ncbi:MAG: flippase [Archaeoglobaceae archaeon]